MIFHIQLHLKKKCYKITNTRTHNEIELQKEECEKIFTIIKNDKLYPCVYYCDDFFKKFRRKYIFKQQIVKKIIVMKFYIGKK